MFGGGAHDGALIVTDVCRSTHGHVEPDELRTPGHMERHTTDDDEHCRYCKEEQCAGADVTHHCLRYDTVH